MRKFEFYSVDINANVIEADHSNHYDPQCVHIPVDHLMAYPLENNYQLVIDSFNDALEIIPDDTWNLIQYRQAALSVVERDYYCDRFFRDKRLFASLRSESIKTLKDTLPVSFVICPTYSCNCACAYCYQRGSRTLDKSLIDNRSLELIFNHISDQLRVIRTDQPARTVVVELFGGEAFQRQTRPIIERIFQFCREQKIVLFCTTNGAELASFLDLFATYHGYIARVATTLDGGRDCHDQMRRRSDGNGSFDGIVSSMNSLLRFGTKTRVAINLGRTNLHQLKDYLHVARDNGWTDNSLVQLEVARIFDRYYSKATEEIMMESELLEHLIDARSILPSNIKFAFLKSALPLARRFGWTYNQNEIGRARFHYCWASSGAQRVQYIDPQLNVYRCTCTTGKEEYRIGNLNADHEHDLSSWTSCNSLDCTECWNCPLGGYCGGGCYVSKSIDKSRFCLEEQRSFDYLVRNMVVPRLKKKLAALQNQRLRRLSDIDDGSTFYDGVQE